jgi:hypothetical protein
MGFRRIAHPAHAGSALHPLAAGAATLPRHALSRGAGRTLLSEKPMCARYTIRGSEASPAPVSTKRRAIARPPRPCGLD